MVFSKGNDECGNKKYGHILGGVTRILMQETNAQWIEKSKQEDNFVYNVHTLILSNKGVY